MGRAAHPSEVAKTVLFLASDDASYITGHGMMESTIFKTLVQRDISTYREWRFNRQKRRHRFPAVFDSRVTGHPRSSQSVSVVGGAETQIGRAGNMKIDFTVIAVFPTGIGSGALRGTRMRRLTSPSYQESQSCGQFSPTPFVNPNKTREALGVKDSYDLDNQSAIPSPFIDMIPAFFRAWDNPHAKDDDWINFLSTECLVKFGGYTSRGHDAVREMRAGFIDPVMGPVINLEHNLKTCWTVAGGSPPDVQAFIIKSSIWYLLVNGRRIDTDCITLVNMADNGNGSWHATEYEVFLASSEIMHAVRALKVNGTEN